jgi:anti-sigma B factor antagonist
MGCSLGAKMAFEVKMRVTAPLAVVRVSGELDMSTEGDLLAAVEQATVQGCTLIAVDLSGVEFIDCSALGTLLRSVKVLRRAGGHLVVTAASPQVMRMIHLTGTDWLVELEQGAAKLTEAKTV